MALPSSSTNRTYVISGMTCSHCASSVRDELSEVTGVVGVDVDLAAGRATVSGQGFDDDAVRAAVREAGYEVVS